MDVISTKKFDLSLMVDPPIMHHPPRLGLIKKWNGTHNKIKIIDQRQ